MISVDLHLTSYEISRYYGDVKKVGNCVGGRGGLSEIPWIGGGTRKRGGGHKDFKKGERGHAGSRGGCLKKGGGGLEPPYEL